MNAALVLPEISQPTTVEILEDWQLRYWLEDFGVPERHLRVALVEVGTDVKTVRNFLAGKI